MTLNKRDYTYVSAKKYLGDQISEFDDRQEYRKFWKYLAYNFYKATNSTGATIYFQVEGQGSSRQTNIEGIQQAFNMEFGFRLKTEKGEREPLGFRAIPFVIGETFAPQVPEAIVRKGNGLYFNTYAPPLIQYDPELAVNVIGGDINPLMHFLRRLFPKEDECMTFLNWLSATVARPEWRCDWAPVLRSDEGTGKNVLWTQIVQPLVGKPNAPIVPLDKAVAKHAADIYHSVAVYIDEVYSNKKAATDRLKPFITADDVFLDKKYMTQYRFESNFNVMISSNDDVPLYIEEGDRRFWIPERLRHKESPQDTTRFISKELIPWLKHQNGLQLIRNFLEKIAEEINPQIFLETPPMTPAKQAILVEDQTDTRKEKLKQFILQRPSYRFDIPTIQEWPSFKFLSQHDIREVMGEIGWAKWDKDRGKWVGTRKTDIDPKRKPEVFIHPKTKRNQKPPYWTPELERRGDIVISTDDAFQDSLTDDDRKFLQNNKQNKIAELNSELLIQNEDWTEEEVQMRQLVLENRTVVANKHRHWKLIEWAKEYDLYVNIQRQYDAETGERTDKWGNNDSRAVTSENRDEVCDSFESQFSKSHRMQHEVFDLIGKVLVCGCSPKRCHGDTLAREANKFWEENETA